MSDQQTQNGGFAKAFVPGLVLGLVIGAFVGATLPTVLSGSSLPERDPAATSAGPRDEVRDRDPVPDPIVDSAEIPSLTPPNVEDQGDGGQSTSEDDAGETTETDQTEGGAADTTTDDPGEGG